jgi:hypothetical protein
MSPESRLLPTATGTAAGGRGRSGSQPGGTAHCCWLPAGGPGAGVMAAVLLVVLLAALSAATVGSSTSVAGLNGAGGPGGGSPWPEAASRRAQATLKQMSTDEKLLLTYGFNKPPPECPHREPHLCPHWYVGNVRAQPAFGLPPINLEDGPQGVADGLINVTGWPSQLTVACAWDPELMRIWGAAMGAEQVRGRAIAPHRGGGSSLHSPACCCCSRAHPTSRRARPATLSVVRRSSRAPT